MTYSLNWPVVQLDDVAEDITVGHVGPMAAEYISSGVPFLRSQNVEPFRLSMDDVKHVSHEFHARLSKSALRPGYVVIVRTGRPGSAAVIPANLPIANCADLVIVRPGPQLDPHFLMYYINSRGSGHVASHLVGAVQQHFNVGSARTMQVPVPPLSVQRRIARSLGAFDEKIELNRCMSRTLESIAHALFQAWFVEFSPMLGDIESVAAGPLPELAAARSWLESAKEASAPDGGKGRAPLSSLCDSIVRGVTPKYGSGSGRMIINQRANRGPYLDPGEFKELDASLEIPGDRMASTGDVLVNSLGEGTLGRTHLFLGEDRVLAVDQHITICRPKANAAAYVYLTLSSREGQARIAALKTGSTGMTMLNISRLRSLQVLAPPNEVLDAFARVSLPLLSIAATSEQESRTLTAMRNALLPRLFGGRMPPGEAGMEASASDECRRLLHESLVELSCLEDVIGNPGVPLT